MLNVMKWRCCFMLLATANELLHVFNTKECKKTRKSDRMYTPRRRMRTFPTLCWQLIKKKKEKWHSSNADASQQIAPNSRDRQAKPILFNFRQHKREILGTQRLPIGLSARKLYLRYWIVCADSKMSTGGQFCLRWNNHQPNMVSVFTSLLQNDQLVDVTLLAENNEIHAHKIVLSACSPYFQVSCHFFPAFTKFVPFSDNFFFR